MLGRTHSRSGAETARLRLLQDQQLRPLVEQRKRLRIVSAALERAGHAALITLLSARVGRDPRYASVLQKLIRSGPR